MAQANAPESNPMALCTAACRADDVSLMEQAISIASEPHFRYGVQDVVQSGLKHSARRGAVHVLRYVLDRGADVGILSTSSILASDEEIKPSQEALAILVNHGWDINNQGPRRTSWPLLWHVADYPDLVVWCLDHGAKIDVPDNPPQVNADGTESRSGIPRPTILGMAASSGSIETFELLRARGAPFDPRTLHIAVEKATISAPKIEEESGGNWWYKERMDMVRHLVDVVKLDVNAIKHKVGTFCSTPLCNVARRPTKQNFRELVFFLLDRGADPNLGGVNWPNPDPSLGGFNWPSPIACAQSHGNTSFLKAVEEWGASKPADGVP